ncbi:MAG TPA: ABC transporter permease [Thermoanaerobaculia bacterium]|nr:ABC transporter permease [Thermoanaerobaculia bacterium]
MRVLVESLQADLRYALHLFRKAPLSTAAIVLVLAFGLGLHLAVLAFYRTFFLAPIPGVQAPDRLAIVAGRGSLGGGWLPISYLDYRSLAAASRTLSPIAAYRDISVALPVNEAPRYVLGEIVSPGFFELLGAHARLGRTLQPGDDESGDPQVVVLSSYLWQTSFGGDPHAVGRKILINQAPFTIVGVMDREFVSVEGLSAPRLWVPLAAYRTAFPEPEQFLKRESRTLLLVGRLRQGATFSQARLELDVIARRLEQDSPAQGKRELELSPLAARIAADRQVSLRHSTVLLLLLSTTFLLVACSNLANLLLARGLTRHQEIRTRYQLGASQGRLVRQFLTESLVLSLIGGLLAPIGAWGLLKLLIALKPPVLPGLAQESFLGPGVYLFELAAALAIGLVAGAAPALQVWRGGFLVQRESAGPGASVSRGAILQGRCSIAFQALLCTVSLACAGFFVSSLLRLAEIDPGFARKGLLVTSLDLKSPGYSESEGRQLQQQLLLTLGSTATIRAAALAGGRPLGGFNIWRDVSLVRSAQHTETTLVASQVVSSDYFRCLGIPLLRGRGFDTRDQAGAPPAVIVNEAAVQRFWPRRDPLGQRLYLDDEGVPVEVVGVARDAQYIRLGEAAIPVLYLASSQRYLSRSYLHVRFTQGERDAVAAVSAALRRLSRVRPGEIQTISQVIERSLWLPRLEAVLLSVISLFGLALAITGMAGVTALFGQQRRRDLGIRAALGATPGGLFGSAVGREVLAAGGGATAGVAAAWLIHLRVANLLFESQSQGLQVAWWAAALTLSAAFLASGIPAARWCRQQPALWLRF